MPETWDVFPGNSVKVGVLDTGIDATHPDLRDNVDADLGWNCAKKANVDTMDYHSHGTHVAGIIGAKGNNSIGFAGAFAYCTSLSTIYKDGCEKQNGVFDLTGVSKFWSGWGHNFKRTYVDTVKLPKDIDISEYCFYNCSRLGRVEFDNTQISPVTIGECAFYGVNYGCIAFMHLNLVNNPSFQLKRNSTTNIPKRTY